MSCSNALVSQPPDQYYTGTTQVRPITQNTLNTLRTFKIEDQQNIVQISAAYGDDHSLTGRRLINSFKTDFSAP